MYATPAPYLDAMPPLFYQYFWPSANTCVTKTVLDFLNKGIVQPNLNKNSYYSHSQNKNPTGVTKFRPISLCNVVYKLVSKTLANKLKKIYLLLSLITKVPLFMKD